MQIEGQSCNVLGKDDTTTSAPKRLRTEEPVDDIIGKQNVVMTIYVPMKNCV